MDLTALTAIVINWRLKDETLRCLRSLAIAGPPGQVIVVDNGSGDGSAEEIARHAPDAEMIALPANLGFAAACNHAITCAVARAECAYVLLVNNDAVLHPGALRELLSAAQAHPTAGILGAKIYYRAAPDRIWYAGARRRRGVLAAAGGRGQIDRGQFAALHEVDYVFGTVMLIRREVIERIGLFDERFFLYLEDLDFCLRTQATGFKLLFVPQAIAWHQGSASTASNQGLRKYHMVKSTVHFLNKHTAPQWRVPVLIFWALVGLRAIVLDLLRGDMEVLGSCWRGLWHGLSEEYRT